MYKLMSNQINQEVYCISRIADNACIPFDSTNVFFVASGLTAGQSCIARAASSSAYLGWSAEL